MFTKNSSLLPEIEKRARRMLETHTEDELYKLLHRKKYHREYMRKYRRKQRCKK